MNAHQSQEFPARLIRFLLTYLLFCSVALSQASDPKPQDATKAILAAFDKYQVVGMSAEHGFKDLDDYILSLIRNPAFANKVNDIVVECGNRMYQDTLDRYIAGEDVPLAKNATGLAEYDPDNVQLVWFLRTTFSFGATDQSEASLA